MQFKECLSEASRECWCRFCDSTFCTGKLSCESRQEVVLCLFRSQYRYRWKYSESVCRQEDYILSCRCRRNRTYNIFNVVNRIRYTCIFCYTLISEINFSFCIKSYVLKKSVTSDCVVDIWFRFFVKVDNLSVASTFKVEYSVVIPAVFVITDEETLRVCRKCSCISGIFSTELCKNCSVNFAYYS